MITIKDIQNIKLSQVGLEEFRDEILDFLNSYDQETAKEIFLKENQEIMDEIYGMVKTAYPNAIVSAEKKDEKTEEPKTKEDKPKKKETPAQGTIIEMNDKHQLEVISKEQAEKKFNAGQSVFGIDLENNSDWPIQIVSDLNEYEVFAKPVEHIKEEKKATPKPKEKPKPKKQRSESSKKIIKDAEKLQADCRELNRQKRKDRKPAVRKSPLQKITHHIESIIKLSPDSAAVNRKAFNQILVDVTSMFGMNKIKQAKTSINKTLDEMEQKANASEQKEMAAAWKQASSKFKDHLRGEIKASKEQLKALESKVTYMDKAIDLIKTDPKKGYKLLTDKFTHQELGEYLPKEMLTQLKNYK